MSMLSDRDLFKLIKELPVVEPFNPENCKGATINLTLDPLVKKYISNEPIILGKEVTEDHYRQLDLTKEECWLKPHESALIQTHEFIQVPENMAARIYERFSVKSLALTISPAHYMNPGYRGKISLVAINNTSVPIRLVQGVKICQFALFELSSDPLSPYEKQDGKYMDARNVSISKLHLDKDIQEFLNKKGVNKVSSELANDLGDHLMKHIKKAADELAEIGLKHLEKTKGKRV
jgi:dCTP deaminase